MNDRDATLTDESDDVSADAAIAATATDLLALIAAHQPIVSDFAALPQIAKKALLTYLREGLRPAAPARHLSQWKWGYVHLPMTELTQIVLANINAIKTVNGSRERFVSFAALHAWYVKIAYRPKRPISAYTEHWPIFVDPHPENHDLIKDGSHRFNAYYAQGKTEVWALYNASLCEPAMSRLVERMTAQVLARD
jgi:hypothetical protein